MALNLQFTVEQSDDAATLYLIDSTGDYDASTNPGGYGGSNTARSDLALLAVATYKATSGDVDLVIAAYDPEVVTQFVITAEGSDGWTQFKVFPVARKTGSETPSTNDFVYDFTANQLQRWNGSSWVSATVSELVSNDKTHVTEDYPVLYDLWLAYNNLNKLIILGCATETKSDLHKYLVDTRVMLVGTIALFAEGSFSQAQKNIEKYQSRVDVLKSLTTPS